MQTPSFSWVFANIFAKRKIFTKKFLPGHMGPRWSFCSKKCRKSRDTVPLILYNEEMITPSFTSFKETTSCDGSIINFFTDSQLHFLWNIFEFNKNSHLSILKLFLHNSIYCRVIVVCAMCNVVHVCFKLTLGAELGARSWICVPAFLAFLARGPTGTRFFLKHSGTQNAEK